MSRVRLLLLISAALLGACRYHAMDGDGGGTSDGSSSDLSTIGGSPDLSTGGSLDLANTSDGSMADLGVRGVTCATDFRYQPGGRTVSSVQVTGEFNNWATPGIAMQPQVGGVYTATVPVPPGRWAYKLLIDGNWELDPGQGRRKYVGGVENSAVQVADCRLPSLSLSMKAITRASAGQGRFTATVTYKDGTAGAGLDASSVVATLRHDDQSQAVSGVTVDANKGTLALDVGSLPDGKYTIEVSAKDKAGGAAKPLRLVFWIEAETFDWRDAVIYMVMVDRFQNGDKTNDPAPHNGVDPRADYHGGDLAGLRARIADGTFDKLGIRALWLSPFHQNTDGAFPADDGQHSVTGYHGYWPVKAREVDPRLGGEAALKAVVAEAHAHGIRVLQDFVINHVHQEHEYFKAHPDWFRTGCICGTNNCDWTAHRLDCLFASYMPDVNWTVNEVSAQYEDDVTYWIDHYDLDGLRLDAVKHVEDAATLNLSTRIREEFETAGTRVFLTGETAMGWSDCGLQCNADNYGTIARYIGAAGGTFGLDGQTDFVTYYAVPMQVFSSDAHGMIHADYWTQQSVLQYPAGAIMTPYVGSQDTPRFTTLADYRGQDAAHDGGIPGNKWSNIAVAPSDGEPYSRLRLAMSWLLSIPGAPMVYYGDEYGEWGGADPNNRVDWRGGGTLATEEQTTLAWTRQLGAARKELIALRRGNYQSILNTETTLLFARQAAANVALVALNKSTTPATVTATLPQRLGLANGTVLRDRMGGANVTVMNGAVTIQVPARAAAILAP